MFFLEGGRFQFGSGFEAICRMRGGGVVVRVRVRVGLVTKP